MGQPIEGRGDLNYDPRGDVSKLRIGATLLPNSPWPELVARVQRFEGTGLDTMWVADHFTNPYAPEEDWYEGWSVLAGLAAATTSIRVGTLVSPLTLRNPALLARSAMTVDHISGGRLELGVGPGGAPLDHSMTGTPWLGPPERVARFEEFVEVVDELLRHGSRDRRGTHFDIEHAVMKPAPVQRPRPPLTIGALGRRTMKIAARFADRWNSYPVLSNRRLSSGILTGDEAFQLMATRAREFDTFCEQAGRDPTTVGRSLLTFFGYRDPWPNVSAFTNFIGRYNEIGFTEFIVYLPSDPQGEDALRRLLDGALPQQPKTA